MPNFLQEDIYTKRSTLTFLDSQALYKQYLIPFRNCLAEPTSNDKLHEHTLFQIVDVRDINKPILSIIEHLKVLIDINETYQDRQRTGKPKDKPRSAINNVDLDEEHPIANNNISVPGSCIYRLTLQDGFGNLCYAYEAEPLTFLKQHDDPFSIKLGSKLVIYANAKIIFNTLHLKNCDVKFLGGCIDKLDYKVYERKLKELKEEIGYEG